MPDEPVEDADAALGRLADIEPLPEDAPAADAPVVPATAIEPIPVDPIPVAPEDPDYTPGGVPTFDFVREKIETRYGTSLGAAELDAATPEGRSVDEQYEARQRAAAERLAQIRAAMKSENS